jgi:tRNA1Val (adenine37-N6)-methyltransferase
MFQFKQFSVDQTGCAMKINTDGVLLGALAEAEAPLHILDIGTGTGVIALILAQRFADAAVDAVEIDRLAAETAKKNFAGSPFADRLKIYPLAFEDHLVQFPDNKYDLIVSNPPFYINSLLSPSSGKTLAKHADDLFFPRLIEHSAKTLKPDGSLWLILPPETVVSIAGVIVAFGLYINKIIAIRSIPADDAHRQIIALSRKYSEATHQSFTIYQSPKVYTDQYKTTLHDFFTIFA